MCYNGGNPYVNMFCFDHEFEGKVNKMAKKDHLRWNKKEAVSDEVIEVAEVEVETNDEPTGIEARKREEREKCEAMSNDDLIEYVLQTKENLWGSYEQREKLEEGIKPLEDKNKELSIQVSDLEKDKKELIDKMTELKEKFGNLERKAALVDELKEQVSELQGEIKDKDNAAKNTQLNLEKSHKKETDDLTGTIAELEKKLEGAKTEIKILTADLKKAVRKANDSEATADELKEKYLEDDLREELMAEDQEAVEAELDTFIENQQKELDLLKNRLKSGRKERFEAKKLEMEERRADAEEDQRLANEIREDEEYEAKLRARTEAKKAKKAAKMAQSKQK